MASLILCFFASIISSNAQLYIFFYHSMHKINVCSTKFVCCCLMLYRGNRAVPWDSQHNQCNDWVSSMYQRERRHRFLPSVIIPCLSPHHLHIVLLQSVSSNLPLQTSVSLLLLLHSLQFPSPSPFVFLLYELSQLSRMIEFQLGEPLTMEPLLVPTRNKKLFGTVQSHFTCTESSTVLLHLMGLTT